MRLMGRRLAVLALCGLLSACGSRVSPGQDERTVVVDQTAQASDAPADSGAAADPQATSADGSTVAPTPADGTSDRPSARPSPKLGSKHNNGKVKLDLSAGCVAPGSVLVVTITAPPKAGLGMVIGFADSQAHGAMLTGESDAEGRYVWRVPVDPTVPEGDARVLVSATGPNWSQEGGGTADKVFRVAKAGC